MPQKKTCAELQAWLATLDAEQLAQPIRWMGEERGGVVHAFEVLAEDQVNPSGDGLEAKSSYVEDLVTYGTPRAEAEAIAETEVVLRKGTPLLVGDL